MGGEQLTTCTCFAWYECQRTHCELCQRTHNLVACATGRLGTGRIDNELQPLPILGGLEGEHAVSAAAGAAHTVIITARGNLYAFGRHGVNGIDGGRDVLDPEQVILPTEAAGATQASASWFYTLVSTRSGMVYEFGGQRYGGASQATPSRVVRTTCSKGLPFVHTC